MLPQCLASVLRTTGLLTCPLRLLERQRDWESAISEMRCILPRRDNLVPFADDGTGNYFALVVDDDDGSDIVFVDHDRQTATRTGQSFTEYAARAWEESKKWLEGVRSRSWHMQFSFDVVSDSDIELGRLAAVLKAALGKTWKNEEDSPAGVQCSERDMWIGDASFVVKRQEYPGWKHPILYINVVDPESRIEDRWIERFRDAFRSIGIRTEEIDYGLLPDED